MPEPITYREKIKEIQEIASDICSEWEIEFLESVENWRGEHTEKQKEIIDRIYQKACDSGL
jgi:hypothetical protein